MSDFYDINPKEFAMTREQYFRQPDVRGSDTHEVLYTRTLDSHNSDVPIVSAEVRLGNIISREGLCQSISRPELFVPPPKESSKQRDRRLKVAHAVCIICPVKQECYDYAVQAGCESGVWGDYDFSPLSKQKPKPIINLADYFGDS